MNPIPHYDLEAMRNVDIRTVDSASLSEISDIDIKPDLPFIQKALDYLRQTKNAYCFRCGDVTIKISHSKKATSINDCMEGFFQTI
ncbi:MAG: hypothetical protein FWF05_07085 [Oscillospiraceae bacterium]|nr:hypothetical protein [Oscillospiraceae bacterium]